MLVVGWEVGLVTGRVCSRVGRRVGSRVGSRSTYRFVSFNVLVLSRNRCTEIP